MRGPLEAPDFKQVRKYLKEISERERLDEFIKAGWTPGELGEYARQSYLVPGRTYPTALSYQIAVTFGPESELAKIQLRIMRAPGYVLPPFNRPVPPPPIPFDHPDHPEHTPETREDVREIARCLRNRRAQREQLPPPDPNKPIPPSLWKTCFHFLRYYGSLDEALMRRGLTEYR
jgi:hypothetical protein